MKISSTPENPVVISNNATALAAKSAPSASTLAKSGAPKGTQSAGVAVTVSSLARTLESSSAGASAEVDTAKVNSVKAAISQGTYVVNPEVIADKLLSSAKDMLKRTQR